MTQIPFYNRVYIHSYDKLRHLVTAVTFKSKKIHKICYELCIEGDLSPRFFDKRV